MTRSFLGDLMAGLRGDELPGVPDGPPVVFNLRVEVPGKTYAEWRQFALEYSEFAGHLYNFADVIDRTGDALLIGTEERLDDDEEVPAIRAFRAVRPLPFGYYRINDRILKRAYSEGIKRAGVEWWKEDDDPHNDIISDCIQFALFGEVRV